MPGGSREHVGVRKVVVEENDAAQRKESCGARVDLVSEIACRAARMAPSAARTRSSAACTPLCGRLARRLHAEGARRSRQIFSHVTAEAARSSAHVRAAARLLILARRDLCDALAYGLARRVCDANAVATSADAAPPPRARQAARGSPRHRVGWPTRRCRLCSSRCSCSRASRRSAYRIARALWEDGDQGAALLLQARVGALRRRHPSTAPSAPA